MLGLKLFGVIEGGKTKRGREKREQGRGGKVGRKEVKRWR